MSEMSEYWVNVYKPCAGVAIFGADWADRRTAIATQGEGVNKAAYRIHVILKPPRD